MGEKLAEPRDSTLASDMDSYLNTKDPTNNIKRYWLGLSDPSNTKNYVWESSGTALSSFTYWWDSTYPTR
jgi:hypothetical protein